MSDYSKSFLAGRAALATLTSIVLLASGCASVPMADDEQDAKLKSFTVKPDKAALYVYRNELTTLAGAVLPIGWRWEIRFTVLLDGKLPGDTVGKTYLYAEIEPGDHKLISEAPDYDSFLSFTAVAGKIYYVWQEMKFGRTLSPNSSGSQLHLVDEKTGQAGVLESKLVAPVQ